MTATLSNANARTTTADDRATFDAMVARLSKLSVEKHADAFVDIPWDDPEYQIDPTDPRWVLFHVDPLADTAWFKGLSDQRRAEIGLYRVAACMKTGWHFENLLQQGLLVHALQLPNGAPEFRYLHHEIIEESQHTLMFQELVNRSGLPVRGMPRWALALRPVIMHAAKAAPCLFFIMVLGGEDPIDYVQRKEVQRGEIHPLALAIMKIHIAEEARHLSFARHQLKLRVPKLGWFRREFLGIAAPVVLGIMVRLMLDPQADLRRACKVPAAVAREARTSQAAHSLRVASVRKAYELLQEVGVATRRNRWAWRVAGLIER